MKLSTLILRSLLHYRALNAALILGIALATAILTGSLLVGDSVRGSLHDLALARLGPITHVLSSPRPVPESLAKHVQQAVPFDRGVRIHPAFILRGRAATSDSSAAGVQIVAAGETYEPYPVSFAGPGFCPARKGRSLINAELASHLNNPARGLILSFPQVADIPRDAILATRARSEIIAALRVGADIDSNPADMYSLFELSASQRTPRNAWVTLKDLQDSLELPNRINTLLVEVNPRADAPTTTSTLNIALKGALTLDDLGLELTRPASGGVVRLTSRSIYFLPALETAADATAIPLRKFNTNLLNSVSLTPSTSAASAPATQPAALHYVVAAGISALDDGTVLAPSEVAINQWTADHLHARLGDSLTFTLYRRQPNGDLRDVSSPAFKIARILPMSGLGADTALTPNYKGLTDADSIHDWHPPEGVKIDKSLVTPDDEAYWKQYRAAPKIFFNFAAADTLFASPFGHLTQIRLPAAQADAFTKSLLDHVDPASLGLTFIPLRDQQLAAAAGSTDFSGLFIGFSFFLILAALILLSLLFRLSVEQRSRQLGLLAALGFAPQRIRRIILAEGLLLALLGTFLGTLGGLAYTALMIKLLTTLWLPAVGTTELHLHAAPASLLTGAAISLLLSALTLILSARKLAQSQPLALLAGHTESPTTTHPSKSSKRPLALIIGHWSLVIATVAAALAILLATLFQALKPEIACLLSGLTLLLAALFYVRRFLRRPLVIGHWSLNLRSLALRNARLRPTRSLLVIALIACASFILILVGSMKQSAPADPALIPSGTGGYRLILTADIPLLGDLNTPQGRNLLGLRDPNNPLLTRARFTNLHAWQGQDISCLNMTKPTQPTILGIPTDLYSRFDLTRAKSGAINQTFEIMLPIRATDPIPTTADADTAQYILHLNLGDTLPLTDQTGATRQLHLTTLLHSSIFQSELLIPDYYFRLLFPLQTGTSVILIECPPQDAAPLARLLESELDDFSVLVEPTTARLQRYKDVANTYLATFQTLGGFGLLLGTLGLAIVLLRSALERRAELALLLALGFTPARVAGLVLLENTFLLAAGLLLGTLTALLAVAPAARTLNLPALALSFAAIFAAGFLALLLSLRLASRHLSPASLRND